MQTLYAFNPTEAHASRKNIQFLKQSMQKTEDLYYLILALFIAVHKKSIDYYTKSQQKLSNTRFDLDTVVLKQNGVLNFIATNTTLNNLITKRKLNYWELDFEYVDILFKAIIKSDFYKSYASNSEQNFSKDKAFILDVFKNIIASNDKLYNYIEDKNLTWVDDFPVVNTLILKTLKKLKLTSPETLLIPNLFKDEDDEAFALTLFNKTVMHSEALAAYIGTKTKNWDSDRLAQIDMVLLKMALCEFEKFPSIPYKVTINEYLEIAKAYSTPKSNVFINGILDKISKDYQNTKPELKSGRGLM